MTPTIAVLIIFLVTCAALIALVFAKPAVMIGGKKISIFWLAPEIPLTSHGNLPPLKRVLIEMKGGPASIFQGSPLWPHCEMENNNNPNRGRPSPIASSSGPLHCNLNFPLG